MKELFELQRLLKNIPRSQKQVNTLFESDCEILKLSSGYLALSTDSISEEISQGLYQDPFTWGWLTIMSSVSDLAASGSRPLGLLLSTEWKFKTPKNVKTKFYKGVRAALKKAQMQLLGGDSGSSAEYFFNATVLGESKLKPLMRRSVKPGDYVCILGRKKLGSGPAFALRFLLGLKKADFREDLYRPEPNPKLLSSLRPFLRASIDTSDGLANSLNIISELNHIGFKLNYLPELMHPKALEFCRIQNLHPLQLWMGDLGDYQTLVFIAPESLRGAQRKCAELLVIGRAVKDENQCSVSFEGREIQLPLHILKEIGRDLNSLRRAHRKMCKYFA